MTKKGRLGLGSKAPARGTRPGLFGLLLLGGLSCSPSGSAGIDGTLVRLRPSIVDAATVRADLSVTAKSPTGQDATVAQMFASGPFVEVPLCGKEYKIVRSVYLKCKVVEE